MNQLQLELQVASNISRWQQHIHQLTCEYYQLEEEIEEFHRSIDESDDLLHSPEELYLAERLQYNFIASDYHSQYGMEITSLPFFFVGELVHRTRTVIAANGERRTRRYHFWKVEHPHLTDDDENQTKSYRANYRMSKRAFVHLVNQLSNHPAFDLTAPNTIPIFIQIASTLLRLANCHIGYRLAYMHLGISAGSFRNFTVRTLEAIKGTLGHLVAWPTNPDEAREVASGFGSETGDRLNNVIGAMDGKNFKIHMPSPKEFGAFFLDRKNNYSIKLTAVCDSDLRFTYIRVGDSGRTHDAAAFRSSKVYSDILEDPATYFPGRTFLVADSAYPLGVNLITPYPESQCLVDERKRTFNHVHSSTRMAIEKAFGVLVARWRFTGKYIYVLDQLKINNLITACCILHNMCIDLRDPGFEPILENIRDTTNATEANPDADGNDRRDEAFVDLIHTRDTYRNGTREV